MGKNNTYGVCSVLEPEEKGLLGKCGRRRENNLEMEENGRAWNGVMWHSIEGCCDHGDELSGSIKQCEICD